MHLDTLFSPQSIAVIGASTKAGSVGYTLTENLLKNGYRGKVYPVNPKTDRLFDLPCYKRVADIPEAVDLAIIIVPADIVPAVLREAGEKNIRAAIIISSGFKETGATGKALEETVLTIAQEFDITLLGPNCLGFLHPKIGLNASFAKHLPHDGSIAFFSQSGALSTALIDLSVDTLDFSHFVSIGNKTMIGENELLRYFAKDENVKTLGFYTEGLTDGNTLIKIGREILARAEAKPIIVLKSGTTTAGESASGSHTGALAGNDATYSALFKQARIVRAANLEQLTHFLTAFSHNSLPENNRLAIVTNAGGLGVLATDAAVTNGLRVATLSQETQEKLTTILPKAGSALNPIDVLGDALADRYRAAMEIVVADDQIDMLLVIVTPQTMTQAKETAEAIVSIKQHTPKPIIAVFAGKVSFQDGLAALQKNAITTVTYPEAAAEALAALAQVANWRKETSPTPFSPENPDHEKAATIIQAAKNAGRAALTEKEASEILIAYGFPFFATSLVNNKEEAASVAEKIDKKVALKIVSPDIIHKSDVGGVILNVEPKDAGEAYEKLMAQVKEHVPKARLLGALVVEMAEEGGQEIILGLKKEPGLGTVVLAGLGGIFVETFKDTALRFAPLTREDAEEMLHELKAFPLLQGTRGQHGIHLETLITMIGRLSQLAEDFPEIAELDLNPLLSFPKAENFRVLDARIRLEK
ncbi:MAG: acetate--CoA ligase family protein [Candidatus Moranbacteria bacterium]|nr:acetate--CoA ligase family protein [Candidatus Moranbacteria bacterium]